MTENITIKGTLTEVLPPTLVERISSPELLSPEQVYLTRVGIQRQEGLVSTQIYGIVPETYVGKEVELQKSYFRLPTLTLFMEEFYVEGKKVINQIMLKKE